MTKHDLELAKLKLNEDETHPDNQIRRIQAILGVNKEEEMVVNDDNLTTFSDYLSKHADFSASVTGIEDFR